MSRFSAGARSSKLSVAQTQWALDFLSREFPDAAFDFVAIDTPGDRDLATPIERSSPDFFTRDLDDAVRAGRIDFAVHSAKDLPSPIADDLDWFWLPEGEDPRDALVFVGDVLPSHRGVRIGVSSARRREYALKRFPDAELPPIRGAIDSRIAQLVEGRFDVVIMAMAGLKRLYPRLPDGVKLEVLPISELEPPEAQGRLAIVFKAGNERMAAMRSHFVKAVRFVSAGVGSAALCTVAGIRDLAYADEVLYDDLMGGIDDFAALVRKYRGDGVMPRFVPVGKRCGAHSMLQPEITRLICDEARKGKRVVRLKGGDAGLFGRLQEETSALESLRIPFRVRPGVSALVAATTGTGMLLTSRGKSRGFTAYTPRSEGAEMPRVAFMASRLVAEEADSLIAEGWKGDTPCALVRSAAGIDEEILHSTLADASSLVNVDDPRPGLFIAGGAAALSWPKLGRFAGRRMLVTCSDAVRERAILRVEDFGGVPVPFPLIEMHPSNDAQKVLSKGDLPYDAVALTSPSSVRIFFEMCKVDRRRLPEFYTCGAGTDAELQRFGVASDLMPESDFSAAGLIKAISGRNLAGRRILRLRSEKAGSAVAEALRSAGAQVDDVVLYHNLPTHESPLPPFDDVWFASASAVEVFLARYGADALFGKGIYVMGNPTRSALPPEYRSAQTLTTV